MSDPRSDEEREAQTRWERWLEWLQEFLAGLAALALMVVSMFGTALLLRWLAT